MGEMIEFARPDGQQAPGYLAKPKRAGRPGVVVIQEWWGLNAQIKKTADSVADAGFVALVPDLYRGKLAANADEAGHMMGGLDWEDAAQQDLKGALQLLKSSGHKAAVMGFCMGGALTLIAAANLDEPDAAVCFYGIPPDDAADPTKIKVPFLAHFAHQDDWCTPEAVDLLKSRLDAGGVNYELHRYDAQHAFMNEKRPEVYSEADAKVAWGRSIAFLRQIL